jgi:hypothetical protein
MATNSSFLSFKSITVPSNGSWRVAVTGQFFNCKEGTDKFKMQVDAGEKFDWEAGLSFTWANQFKQLTFFNETVNAITIDFYVGSEAVRDARLNTVINKLIITSVKDFPTQLVASGTITIAAGQTLPFPGTAAGAGKQRRQIIISNLHAVQDLTVQDNGGNDFATVFHLQAWNCPTSADLKLKNKSGADIQVQIGETYYTS